VTFVVSFKIYHKGHEGCHKGHKVEIGVLLFIEAMKFKKSLHLEINFKSVFDAIAKIVFLQVKYGFIPSFPRW
jgi:hypothetical protein